MWRELIGRNEGGGGVSQEKGGTQRVVKRRKTMMLKEVMHDKTEDGQI